MGNGTRADQEQDVIREIIIRPKAEVEMTEAYGWYEDRMQGLGSDFILSVDAVLHAIARNPRHYQVIYKNIRRALTKRFPYEVFYIKEKSRIIACGHSCKTQS